MEQKQQLQQEPLLNAMIKFVQSYMDVQSDIKSNKIMQTASNETIAKLRLCGIPRKGRAVEAVMDEMVEDVYANQVIMQHPRWFGFVPSPASLLSWLGDIMTSAYDPHAGSWMQSSAAACIEQEVIAWMCRQAGYPDTSGGLFVSGKSHSPHCCQKCKAVRVSISPGDSLCLRADPFFCIEGLAHYRTEDRSNQKNPNRF